AETVPPSPEPPNAAASSDRATTGAPPPTVSPAPEPPAAASADRHPTGEVPAARRPPSSTGSQSKTLVPVGGGYELLQRIGHGQFVEVFRAGAPGGGLVALKRVFRPLDDAATRRERKALDLICRLNHPFLLQTHLYWVDEGRLVIVMELA